MYRGDIGPSLSGVWFVRFYLERAQPSTLEEGRPASFDSADQDAFDPQPFPSPKASPLLSEASRRAGKTGLQSKSKADLSDTVRAHQICLNWAALPLSRVFEAHCSKGHSLASHAVKGG